MRIVAIGLGGAGCRIVDSLYSTDRRSSRVACVQALAIDVTENTLKELKHLPDASKLFFPAADSLFSTGAEPEKTTATIDIAEIISRIHNFESGETDAILVCIGLGGSMADIAPQIITGLRSSVTEPIFGLVTLPCLAEGERRSANAADQIDLLLPLLDGMILFDNETWYKKTKALKSEMTKKEVGLAQRLGLIKEETPLSPEETTYHLLNDAIVRRISLILKAGEFTVDGGIDMAEVVLDSGEVLNTMRGMGFITIGYAVERLPSNPLAFLSQFRPHGVFDEEIKKRASRIVELAKQAIYHEISTPCDMTSADKALVLIAGPSQELSMKGFMTVRKWIDRSIAGLEMRSGDYPVMNTKNVAIIVMLSGLDNIPRISEIREIRAQHRAWSDRSKPAGQSAERGSGYSGTGSLRDEMIVMPSKARETPVSDEFRPTGGEKQPVPAADKIQLPKIQQARVPAEVTKKAGDIVEAESGTREHPAREPQRKTARHQVIITEKNSTSGPAADGAGVHTPPHTSHPVEKPPHPRLSQSIDKDAARQRIELELQKQRLKAIGGKGKKPDEEKTPQPLSSPEPERKPHEVRRVISSRPKIADESDTYTEQSNNQKTVIISRRKVVSHQSQDPHPDSNPVERELPPDEITRKEGTELMPDQGYVDDSDIIEIRDTPYRAKDHVFEGRDVKKTPAVTAKDSALIHTKLRPKTTGTKDIRDIVDEHDEGDSENDTTVKK